MAVIRKRRKLSLMTDLGLCLPLQQDMHCPYSRTQALSVFDFSTFCIFESLNFTSPPHCPPSRSKNTMTSSQVLKSSLPKARVVPIKSLQGSESMK